MNKAFVREAEFDGRAYCPRCGSQGTAVGSATLDALVQPTARLRLQDSAYYCGFSRCDVAYFSLLESVVLVEELTVSRYPYDLDAPICPCFGFTYDEIVADVSDGVPTRIRGLLVKSQSPDAQCQTKTLDGQCCMAEVQKLYMRLRQG
jgi:hypothetical protein